MNDTVSWLTFLSGLFGKDKSKRRYARVVPKDGERIEVRIEGENSGPLQAQDISENGIGIVVPSGFSGRSNGDVVELEITLPKHEPFRTKALVRHFSARTGKPNLFGLQFQNLPEDARVKVAAFVRARMPRVRMGGTK